MAEKEISEDYYEAWKTQYDLALVSSYNREEAINKAAEDALLWNDEALGINWEIQQPILSPKDELATTFNSFISPF